MEAIYSLSFVQLQNGQAIRGASLVGELWDGLEGPRHRTRIAHLRKQPLHHLLLLAFLGREAGALFDLAAPLRSGSA